MDQPMMDVLDGNRERALRYLLATLMLVTLRGGLKSSQGDRSHGPATRSRESEALTES